MQRPYCYLETMLYGNYDTFRLTIGQTSIRCGWKETTYSTYQKYPNTLMNFKNQTEIIISLFSLLFSEHRRSSAVTVESAKTVLFLDLIF